MRKRVRGGSRGSAAIVMLGILVMAMTFVVGAARLASALLARAEADTAADAAALAAADSLALGDGPEAAFDAAEATATRNGARLLSCACHGSEAEVVVEVDPRGFRGFTGPARSRSRAEVGLTCALGGAGCR